MSQYSMQEAIKHMLDNSQWKYRYQVIKLKEDWEKLMGKTVAKHTKEISIIDKKLIVYTDVAALKNELSYNKALLIAKINQYFGENFIREIIVK